MRLKIITLLTMMTILLNKHSYASETMLAPTKTESTSVIYLLGSIVLVAILLIFKIKNR